jgi:Zn-dependent protease
MKITGRALHIGTFAGIPVKIHWTFGFILLLVAWIGMKDQLSAEGVLWLFITIGSLFTCVVLHEYGHALTARRFGIQTNDILLTPIGGIARLSGMPKKPMQEFLIAIAGPMVNVVIMIITLIYLWFTLDAGSEELLEDLIIIDSFPELMLYLFFLNLILFGFNLIPAFPMDGGRILRSLLSLRMNRLKATQIASITGQVLAVVFVLVAVFYRQITLGFIGAFVFIMARREYQMAVLEDRINRAIVSEVYRNRFTVFYDYDPIGKPLELFRKGEELSFLVYNQFNQLIGVIHELFLRNLPEHLHESDPVRAILSGRFERVTRDMPLRELFQLMQDKGYSIVPVWENGAVIGVVDRRDVMRFLKAKGKS